MKKSFSKDINLKLMERNEFFNNKSEDFNEFKKFLGDE